MKKKELQSLRTKSSDELFKLLEQKEDELTKVRVDVKATKEKNLKKGKNLRHELSQIATLLKEKSFSEKVIEGKEEEKK